LPSIESAKHLDADDEVNDVTSGQQ